jgi:hypothetical protein
VITNLVLPLDQSLNAAIDSLASFEASDPEVQKLQEQTLPTYRKIQSCIWRQALEFLSSRGSRFSTAHAWSRHRTGAAQTVVAGNISRFSCYISGIGHAGNGDAMLAYHLMDFSRYFFDQSDIRH